MMARSFLREFCAQNGLKEKPIDEDVLDALSRRRWPGNVRELKNVVERMAILSGEQITLDDLPAEGRLAEEAPSPGGLPSTLNADNTPMSLKEYREHAERQYIMTTLDSTDWNVSQAALKLGVERTNLHKKMRSYGIHRD